MDKITTPDIILRTPTLTAVATAGASHAPSTRFSRRTLLAGTMTAALCLTAAPIRAMALDPGSIAASVEALRPGEFLWAPEAAPDGPVVIIVSLARQRAYVYRNGVLIGISTVSTGAAGHETATGVFTILQKKVAHRSNLYNDAPMPYMQRLTWDGIAMHAGNLPGYPASHGCIRFPLTFAEHLYDVTQLGLTVIITQASEIPRFAPAPRILQDTARRSSFGNAFLTVWQPEKALTGPISIIVSAADQRAVVLRNGIEIGSAPVAIRGKISGLQAFNLASIDEHRTHWMFLPVFGGAQTGEVSRQDRERLILPEDFRRDLLSVLKPGSTLIVTADTLESGSTGTSLTVLTGEDAQADTNER
ncbi:L,D-transpeptidase [Qipengyuania sp. YIM B01966]|uniref:L,D-transpeptidase n=1 Tax=Qipengyuania sp. YIM B01966 TaxID=2778646 RepID=UPI0018F7CD80|nr:L,D-transpeptidase [Qipengyuania sp. YIM B01966]